MNQIVYCGPTGAGLGFKLSGLDVVDIDSPSHLSDLLKVYKKNNSYQLIFVDEGLAQDILTDIENLNQDPLPTIVLLPNPTKNLNLASQKMNRLMIKAIGSDIFSK